MNVYSEIDKLKKRIADQREWISNHGGNLAGYILRYGPANADDFLPVGQGGRYGQGGPAIYAADLNALYQSETELRHQLHSIRRIKSRDLADFRARIALTNPKAPYHHIAIARVIRGQAWNKGLDGRATVAEKEEGIGRYGLEALRVSNMRAYYAGRGRS